MKEESTLVSVFDASSEAEALMVQSLLQQEGIEAAVRSRQIPMYDGIAKVFDPVWGNVIVFEEDSGRARAAIEEYMAHLEEDEEREP